MSIHNELMKDPAFRRNFEKEALALDATELLCELMAEQGISRSELAIRVGKSKAFITQVLSGSRNMTMHTFADLAFALGAKVKLKAVSAE